MLPLSYFSHSKRLNLNKASEGDLKHHEVSVSLRGAWRVLFQPASAKSICSKRPNNTESKFLVPSGSQGRAS